MIKQQSSSQTVGPFFSIGMTYGKLNNLVNEYVRGKRIHIHGRILDGNDVPVTDAVVEIWQADASGIYNHSSDPQHADADPNFFGFGRAATDDDGRFEFKTIKPGQVGAQTPHISLRIFMRGMLLHVNSRLYFSDVDNSHDAVLNSVPVERQHTLIAERSDAEDTPTYIFNVHMQGTNETVFFEP